MVRWVWTSAKISVFENRLPVRCRSDFYQFLVQKWDCISLAGHAQKMPTITVLLFLQALVLVVSTLGAHYFNLGDMKLSVLGGVKIARNCDI